MLHGMSLPSSLYLYQVFPNRSTMRNRKSRSEQGFSLFPRRPSFNNIYRDEFQISLYDTGGRSAARRVDGDLQGKKLIALRRRERGVFQRRYPCTLQIVAAAGHFGSSMTVRQITLDHP